MNAAIRAAGALLVTAALLSGCSAPPQPVDRSDEVLAAVSAVDGVAPDAGYSIDDGVVTLDVTLDPDASATDVAADIVAEWSQITVSNEFGLVLVLRGEGRNVMQLINTDLELLDTHLAAVRLWERLIDEQGLEFWSFVRSDEFAARTWVPSEAEVAPTVQAIADTVATTELLWRPENIEALVEQ